MATQLHIYTNNPTMDSDDGTEVSSGTELCPISVTLDASKAEEKAIKCAVRCDEGFHVDGPVTIKFVGEAAAKWKVANDLYYDSPEYALENADWQDSIEIEYVYHVNKIFWVKATSSTDEVPKNDTSVDLQAEGLIVVTEEW